MISSRRLPIVIFVISLLLGFFLRFQKLGVTPAGFYLDEASIGYNAYSVLKTGKDEYGMSYPLLFRSVGDFKTPIYPYLSIPFIALFDLSPFSVRLLSALVGFLTLPLVFLLVKKFFPGDRGRLLASFASLFLAISPWHLILSRTAYETTVALFFLLLGVYLFLVSLKKIWLLPFSAVTFGLSFLSYHAERMLSPVILLTLIIIYRRDLLSNLKKKIAIFILSLFLGLLIVGPTVLIMRSPGFLTRAGSLSILSFASQMPYGYSADLPGILKSPQLLSVREFASLYTSYFSPRYLFSLGDANAHTSYPGLGTFFVWQFPLLLLGLWELFSSKTDKKFQRLTLALLFFSPIPAALTRDPYSIIRALPMLIPLILIISLGAEKLLGLIRQPFKKILYPVFIGLILFSVTRLSVSLFYYNDYFNSSTWNYGWNEAIKTLNTLDPQIPVIVDDSRSIPYPIVLFFLQFDPQKYQQANFEVSPSEYYNYLSRNPVKNIGRITVRNINWGRDTDHVVNYLVGDSITISDLELRNHRLELIQEIKNPNGTPALRIVKTKPL